MRRRKWIVAAVAAVAVLGAGLTVTTFANAGTWNPRKPRPVSQNCGKAAPDGRAPGGADTTTTRQNGRTVRNHWGDGQVPACPASPAPVSSNTISCPSVADELGTVPARAKAEVDRNLALLQTQIDEANKRLKDTQGQGGPNFVDNAILGPLKSKRIATIDRIAIAIGRVAQKPAGLEVLADCTLVTTGITPTPVATGNNGNGDNNGNGQPGNGSNGLDILGDSCESSGLQPHTGFQEGNRCVDTEFGEVGAAANNPSLLITRSPERVRVGQQFQLRVSTRNLVRDRFLGAAAGGYYLESSFLTNEGLVRGHFHTACRMLPNTDEAPDPAPAPAFFVATEDGAGGRKADTVTINVTGLPQTGTAQCAVWAGDGSHRIPMMERANQTPALDVIRIRVTR
ncbi:hypothetical protein J2S43_000827 [Catenuloplanes nepalensis]|uniref:Uncharacterized protein n=1 Tax=Catenuloplanes nepalensis TaxID=587533 RepID=A0ABT9MLK9_9ACTN|nr:hypothetical protein [Catenuloplanes nepalensis]MDP9792315.1 hypothetical protein [Catenuloplanes nepalensis]